jgi:hypothetical protein
LVMCFFIIFIIFLNILGKYFMYGSEEWLLLVLFYE